MSKLVAASAGFWSAIDVVFRQAVLFAVSIVLARLLDPADFGIVALLTFFTSLSIVFVQGGLTTALIQRQQTSRAEESAVFWFNLLAGALFALLLVALGPALARFYGSPVLQPMMAFAGLQVLLSALVAVQTAIMTRELRFRQLAKLGVFTSVLSSVAALGAAYLGAGVWSLVIQTTLAAFLHTVAIWVMSGWRPIFRLELSGIRTMLQFGFWVGLSSTLDVLYTHGFALLLGKLHGMRELGLYGRAANTQQLPSTILTSIIARVALPLFASRSLDAAGTRRGVRLANSVAMLLNVPALLGLAILSAPVIEVLFGPKWLPAAGVLSILAVAGLVFPLHVINLQLLLAQGDSKLYFRIEITKKLIGIACIVVGSLFGIIGLAWSQVAVALLALLINVHPTSRSIGYGLTAQLRDLRGVFFAAAVMGIAVSGASHYLVMTPQAELPILIMLGFVTYVAVGLGFRLRSFTDAIGIVQELLPHRSTRGA